MGHRQSHQARSSGTTEKSAPQVYSTDTPIPKREEKRSVELSEGEKAPFPWLGPGKSASQDPTPKQLLGLMYNFQFMNQILTSFSCHLKKEKKVIVLDLPALNVPGPKQADFKILSEPPVFSDPRLKETVQKMWDALSPGKEVLVFFHMHPHINLKVYPLEEVKDKTVTEIPSTEAVQ